MQERLSRLQAGLQTSELKRSPGSRELACVSPGTLSGQAERGLVTLILSACQLSLARADANGPGCCSPGQPPIPSASEEHAVRNEPCTSLSVILLCHRSSHTVLRAAVIISLPRRVNVGLLCAAPRRVHIGRRATAPTVRTQHIEYRQWQRLALLICAA